MESKILKLRKELDQLYQIESSMAVLGYDQQVLMPVAASEGRAKQLEFLSGLYHERLSSDSLYNLVTELRSVNDELSNDDKVIVRELHRTLERSRKLSIEFVSEKSRISAESFSVWSEAKADNNWGKVKPYLEKIVSLSRQEAELVGYQEHPYDALLDTFEPYAKISEVKPLLISVAERLKQVLPELSRKYSAPPALEEKYSISKQQAFCQKIMGDLGFDFRLGRLDTAAHPFMSTLGPRDIRITTRYNEESLLPALFGTIHECGHAFYELGLPVEFRGTPRGSAVSMGIHESQSRLWENMVARSRPFCNYLESLIPQFFNSKLNSETIWKSANTIRPSLIRVEADEVTYTLHIVIRMLLEERLVAGELEVVDAPEVWNQLYKEYLGVDVPSMSQGIMQDVHWYGGSLGYFPSYALGNLYGAMFVEQFEKECGDLLNLIENRSFSLLKNWLEKKIYAQGQTYSAIDLVEKVCGKPLSSEAFLAYLSKKFDTRI